MKLIQDLRKKLQLAEKLIYNPWVAAAFLAAGAIVSLAYSLIWWVRG